MDELLTIFVACFAPSIVLLGYYALKDRYEPEPLRLLLGVFASGLIAAPVAILAFDLLARFEFYSTLNDIGRATPGERFAYSLAAIGPVEEMVKFVAVWATVYRFRVIDEPVDGMIYAAAAALGFATYENWYTMVSFSDVLWARAITLPFNHVLFSSFWGYALGLVPFGVRREAGGSRLVVVGLVLAFVYHGLYDFILFEPSVPDLLILPLVLVLWLWIQFAIRRLVAQSPFRPPDEPSRQS